MDKFFKSVVNSVLPKAEVQKPKKISKPRNVKKVCEIPITEKEIQAAMKRIKKIEAEARRRLVEEELDFDPAVGVKTLTELLQGKYIEGREYVESTQLEKQAGAKLAAFLQYSEGDDAPEALTDDEKAAAVQHTSGMVIKAGFYDRLATYCRNVDEVMGVLSIFKPVIYANYAKFCVNGTAADKVGRLASVAEDIIGTLIVEE